MSFRRQLTIMIVEDNRADVYLLQKALHKAEIDFQAIILEDGESALTYLNGDLGREANPTPDLAILDLNVPKRDGSEVLAHIRRTPRLQQIPVIILSSSPKRVMLEQAAQADLYIVKPNELEEFLGIGDQIRACLDSIRTIA